MQWEARLVVWSACLELVGDPSVLAFAAVQPDLLLESRPLQFRCSNGVSFTLIPGRSPEGSRGGVRNLPVELRIGQRRVLLFADSYASNVALKERRSPGLEVWFAGKTGEVYLQSVSNGITTTRLLARFCELAGKVDATSFSL